MLSGALAGTLKLGAVLLTAGGLAGGIYLLVQVGEQEEAASRLQAPQATASAPATVTPPAPTVTPPAIDTSDWLTYTSPLGFTIKYPPGWAVEEFGSSIDAIFDTARITMGHPEGTGEIIIEGGTVKLPPGLSHAWLEIRLISDTPLYPAKARLQGCKTEAPQTDRIREGSTTTLAGQPAGRCFTQELDRTREHLVTVDAVYVALPAGNVVALAAYVFDGDDATFRLIQAILATVSFEATP
jgi:hypothetical protein